MSLEIYHQCGHLTSWNKKAFEELGAGNGLIFSPVHETKHRLETIFDDDTKQASFLDPQFYLPNSQKKKLKTYPFFPETLTNGFSTQDFSVHALDAARSCVEFQFDEGYERIIIPSRFHSQMLTNYCDRQSAYSVTPFLAAIGEWSHDRDVYLTLSLTHHMVADGGFREQLLNWVTGYPEIDGVYLIVATERRTKQITSPQVLLDNLSFIRELTDASLRVVVGYCNSENLLYSVVSNDVDLTFGAYENTRLFSLDKFIESRGGQGPRARIYLPGLLNWVQIEQARDIREDIPEVWNQIYEPTEDSERALNAAGRWAFNKPELYMHHFELVQEQVNELGELPASERPDELLEKLAAAETFYAEIEAGGVALEEHGRGTHVSAWRAALAEFDDGST